MAHPNWMMILPFAALLASIALAPLCFGNWWGKHYPKVSFGLGACVLLYYLLGLNAGERVIEVTFDYIRFIVLIGSLFVVSGGIHVTVKGESTPRANLLFLLTGALVSNIIGTTGASMLLIRPWMRMNKYRLTGYHVVFFIFIVSNVGGFLTPIGDPPLYLGYLKGVPFWWVAAHGWRIWATALCILLAMFYAVDQRNYHRAPKEVRQALAEPPDRWRFEGLPNLFFLLIILGAAFLEHPQFLREIMMVSAAFASYFATPDSVHASNRFNLLPIKEVAILFAGIFATMMPALDWLQNNAGNLGAPSAGLFYAGSGALSSVLDNAPTYLTFLSAALGAFVDPAKLEQARQAVASYPESLAAMSGADAEHLRQVVAMLHAQYPMVGASRAIPADKIGLCFLLGNPELHRYLLAISAGSVFWGANTYIGNGPNFMVKSIADHQKVHTPSFVSYIFKFTIPFMLPMLAIVWWLYFRK